MADVTFISSLLTTSPYPNIKMFKEGFIPAGYIYTDSGNYKPSEDNTFLYCCDQDERDPEGQTTLAIYYDDPGGDPDMEDYTEYANDHPAFYRGRYELDGDTFDLWDMYEEDVKIMTFLTPIITVGEEGGGEGEGDSTYKPFLDFMKYCPKLDASIRTEILNTHENDVFNNIFGGKYNITMAQTGYNRYTTYNLNGTNLYLFYMSGVQGDTSTLDPQKTYTYTLTSSYALYVGTTTMSNPAILTPFYYAGVNHCNPNISISNIFPQTNQNGGGTSYGTQWKKVYLPEFTCTSATANSIVTIDKLHGPYDCDIFNEQLIIIWDRIDRTIKPKYFLRYTYNGTNIPSSSGSGLYGQPLKKIIEIE
jgi:hypothetical protein